jgi:putative two-component system response regulator
MLSVYIIVVTISSDHESLVKSFELGANDFLTKPIFHQELSLRLRNGISLLRLESQDELILALAKLTDTRSPETGMPESVNNFETLTCRI